MLPKNLSSPVEIVEYNYHKKSKLLKPIRKGNRIMKYVCPCGYEYDPAAGDPDNGIAPGTSWENVPEDFLCPVCGLGKDAFDKED